jgi:hypothetical protein
MTNDRSMNSIKNLINIANSHSLNLNDNNNNDNNTDNFGIINDKVSSNNVNMNSNGDETTLNVITSPTIETMLNTISIKTPEKSTEISKETTIVTTVQTTSCTSNINDINTTKIVSTSKLSLKNLKNCSYNFYNNTSKKNILLMVILQHKFT